MTDQFQEFVNAPADPPPPSLFGFDSQVRLYQEICRRRRALRFQAEYSGKVNSFLWKLTERRLDQIQRELVTALRLDKQHVITCTAKKFRAEFGMRVEEQSRALFGDYVPRKRRQRDDVLVEQILEQVRNATRRSRLKEVMWRLQCELESRHAERWFCIFATLTVDPRSAIAAARVSLADLRLVRTTFDSLIDCVVKGTYEERHVLTAVSSVEGACAAVRQSFATTGVPHAIN